MSARTTNPGNFLGNTSLGTPTLAAPTVSGTGASATVSLSWTVPVGDPANSWQVLRASGSCPAGAFTVITTVAIQSYTDTPGAAGTYCYTIKSKLGSWSSQTSNQQTVSVSPTLPVLIQTNHAETSAAAGSLLATFASAPDQNHLLVAILGTRGSVTINQPAGWSTAINQSGAPGQAIFYKIAGAGESSTVTVSVSGGTTRLGLQIYEYSGVATGSPLDKTASSTGSSSSPASGSATTTQAIELLIAAEVLNANTSISSWTNSFLEENDHPNGGVSSRSQYGGADRIVQSTGTYSTTGTAGSSAAWRGQLVTFKAAP